MDYILWLILIFLASFLKCLGFLLALAVAYYIFLKIVTSNDKVMKIVEDKINKGDNQSLFFLQLNNRTKIYKTMEAIHWILIIMLVLCSYQLGKSRN